MRLTALIVLLVFFYDAHAINILPKEKKDFIHFLDKVIEAEMEKHGVPNVTLSVVQGSEIYMLRGYGKADWESNTAVDPENTIFRVASISKSLTATAVMTLVDKGLISLEEDVNTWLPSFKIKGVNGTPVTWHHLLTHSAGLDDKVYFPTAVEDKDVYLSLETAFQSSPPVSFIKSGKVIRYSNQGYSLLGYLIEQVSGMKFEDYVAKYVFEPLGMQNSTFEQVLPDTLKAKVAIPHELDEELGAFVQQPSIYVNEMPAGGLYTTAKDMAHYMLMQLDSGLWRNRRIVSSALIEKMQSPQFTMHPALGGAGYGFWHSSHNNNKIIIHDGNGPSVAARLLLLPEQKIGFFIAQQGGSNVFLLDVTDKILNRYLGESATPTHIQSGSAESYAGFYKDNRYVHYGYFKLPTRIGLELNIRAEGDKLITADPLEGVEREYVEVSPGLFARVDRPETKLAFIKDAQGKVIGMQTLLYHTPIDFESVAWWETNTFLLIVLIVPTIVFLFSVIALPILAIVRKFKAKRLTKGQNLILWFSWLFSLFAFVIMALFVLGDISPLPTWSPHTNPFDVYAFLTFAFFTTIAAFGVPLTYFIALRRKYWRWYGVVGHSILLCGALLFIWFGLYNGLFYFAI